MTPRGARRGPQPQRRRPTRTDPTPAKQAIRALLTALGEARIGVLVDATPSVASESLIRALADPERLNRPTLTQLRELASTAHSLAETLALRADDLARLADSLELDAAA